MTEYRWRHEEKCAYCNMEFESGDQRQMIHGRLYHADLCVKYAKPTAIAA